MEPAVYCVSVDVAHCFDTIKRDRLLRLVTQAFLTQQSYCLESFSSLYPCMGALRARYQRLVYPASTMPAFADEAKRRAASGARNTIFTDGVYRRFVGRAATARLLRTHIYGNIVRCTPTPLACTHTMHTR